jgi:RNA polymerase sigma factor (sigma-70 family)
MKDSNNLSVAEPRGPAEPIPSENAPVSLDPALTREEYAAAFASGYPMTKRYLLSRGVPPPSAEETAQAAWAKGWENLHQLRNADALGSWIARIAMNLYRSHFRRRDTDQLPPDIPVLPNVSARGLDIERALASCTPRDRALIERFYRIGYTSTELATDTGCSSGAIRIRLLRIRRQLRTQLEMPSGRVAHGR